MRRLLAAVMTGEGFACELAPNLAEARILLADFDPELVLLDINLPGESGLTLATELGEVPGGPAVIIVSGEDDSAVAALALDAGALGYVTKPFTGNDLTIAVDNALRRRRESSEGRAHRAVLEDSVSEWTATAHDALERLRRANEETVRRLSKAVEFRDPETGSHIERMSHYCALLAGRLGLDPDLMRVASRLHDIGKIATPDSILLKPGPLTPDEREEMQRHADIGYRLLRGSGIELLDHAAIIAWTHHERHDGTGYPRRLAGEDIPLPGRIAGVADVFDALTTDRVYRPALSVKEALTVLQGERGRQFDPDVLDAFVDELDPVLAIMVRFGVEPEDRLEPALESETLVRLQEAAEALGVTASQLRRLADVGRIQSVRTEGGHRRFPLSAVRKLAAERGTRASVRPLEPPAAPLPLLAEVLSRRGADLVSVAVTALYRGGEPGWFASEEAGPARAEWLAALAHTIHSGHYAGALQASEVFLRRAYLQAVGLLERYSFMEHFGRAALRALAQSDAPHTEIASTRRLFVALQQAELGDRA
jgi:putative two-component system response regulator